MTLSITNLTRVALLGTGAGAGAGLALSVRCLHQDLQRVKRQLGVESAMLSVTGSTLDFMHHAQSAQHQSIELLYRELTKLSGCVDSLLEETGSPT